MSPIEKRGRGARSGCTVLALTLTLAACGSASSSSTSQPAATSGSTTVSSSSSAAQATPPPPPPRLRIVIPHLGAHYGQTLTVHVALSGAAPAVARRFVYVLDRGLTRRGSARLTFTELLPGRHSLRVMLASNRAVRATTAFVVNAPPPPPAPAPAPQAAMPVQAPPPAPAPAPSSGIPQGNGGDMDADNNGGPSDGDGNV